MNNSNYLIRFTLFPILIFFFTFNCVSQPVWPERVSVMPVIYVPKDKILSSEAVTRQSLSPESTKLIRHLNWTQNRFLELLDDRATFEIATQTPLIFFDYENESIYYRQGMHNDKIILKNLLDHYGYDRFSNPYIFFVVVHDTPGSAYCRTINGGINTGGALIVIRQTAWNETNLQSTIQHEIGHSFGLNHVWYSGYSETLRYSKDDSPTMMSYNQDHHTNGFTPSPTPAILLPEEIRNLSLNKRAFPNLIFDPTTDKDPGFDIERTTQHRTPVFGISNDPYGWTSLCESALKVTTIYGQTYGSTVMNVVHNTIRESSSDVGWDKHTMWQSGPVNGSGWVSLDVEFPCDVNLNGLAIHSQHSGKSHAAEEVQVEYYNGSRFERLTREEIGIDDEISFSAQRANKWRFAFKSSGKYVVIRGLRFFTPDGEVFPQTYPIEQLNYPKVTTAYGETHQSKVRYAVKGEILASSSPYDHTSMWHSGPVNESRWVSLDVEFPYPVFLDKIRVHAGYSGNIHGASRVSVEAFQGGRPSNLNAQTNAIGSYLSADLGPGLKAKKWRIAFKAVGEDEYVVIRGMQFYNRDVELFKPAYVE